ncbi:MAG TPA: DinB family protein [Candidatus Dormibacteraeota bacterium]|nr:DinB family protein [Candidatus Dormibacteraeota bacterium]
MSLWRSFVDKSAHELERMRTLVRRLTDDEMGRAVNEHWTAAGILCHIAFWEARVVALADKVERGVPFSPSDAEPEDVDWINDATRPLIQRHPATRRGTARPAHR